MLNKLLITLNVILLFFVIVLFFLFFKCYGKCNQTVCEGKEIKYLDCDKTNNTIIPIAYVDVDTILLKYEFAKEQNEKLLKKQENSRLTLQQKSKQFQEDYMDFQKKIESNVYATRERAEQENNRLMRKQMDLQNLEKKLTEDLLSEQEKINKQLKDTIDLVLAEFNKDKGLHLILSNTMNDNILYAKSNYDVTDEVLALLNNRYKKK